MNVARSSCRNDSSTSISVIRSSAARSSESSTASRSSPRNASLPSRNGHAAREHLGRDDRRAVLLGDRRDDDEDAVRGQHPAVAQRDVGDIADVHAVDEDHARLHLLPSRAPSASISSGVPFSVRKMFSRGTPTACGELGVDQHPLEVAVDRHHVARAREVDHHLDLLRVAVAGGVDRRVAGGDHLAADVVQAVDRLVDGALVAGDRRGAEHHGVARLAPPAGGRGRPSGAAPTAARPGSRSRSPRSSRRPTGRSRAAAPASPPGCRCGRGCGRC